MQRVGDSAKTVRCVGTCALWGYFLTNWLRLDACTLRFNQALPEGVITKKCAFGLLTVGEYTDCPRADAR
jgi:hypothetical protein